jgi:hypothetical protein
VRVAFWRKKDTTKLKSMYLIFDVLKTERMNPIKSQSSQASKQAIETIQQTS